MGMRSLALLRKLILAVGEILYLSGSDLILDIGGIILEDVVLGCAVIPWQCEFAK